MNKITLGLSALVVIYLAIVWPSKVEIDTIENVVPEKNNKVVKQIKSGLNYLPNGCTGRKELSEKVLFFVFQHFNFSVFSV